MFGRVGGNDSWSYYPGILDDIRIYNRALSEAEIDTLYHEGGWDLEDTTPPAPPTGLTATPGDGQVTLTWLPNTEPDLSKYRIYRDISSPASALIDSVVGTPPDTSYTDAGLVVGQQYYYRATAIDTAGNESDYSDVASATALEIDEAGGVPAEFALHANYPNPFNPVTTIRYDLPEATNITIQVYDILGREIARLIDSAMEPGYHRITWNGRDSAGREVPTGIYIARLLTPEYTKSIKMVLLR